MNQVFLRSLLWENSLTGYFNLSFPKVLGKGDKAAVPSPKCQFKPLRIVFLKEIFKLQVWLYGAYCQQLSQTSLRTISTPCFAGSG